MTAPGRPARADVAMDVDRAAVPQQFVQGPHAVRQPLAQVQAVEISHRNPPHIDPQGPAAGLDAIPIQVPVIEVVVGLQVQDGGDAVIGLQMVDIIGAGRARSDEELRQNLVQMHDQSPGVARKREQGGGNRTRGQPGRQCRFHRKRGLCRSTGCRNAVPRAVGAPFLKFPYCFWRNPSQISATLGDVDRPKSLRRCSLRRKANMANGIESSKTIANWRCKRDRKCSKRDRMCSNRDRTC